MGVAQLLLNSLNISQLEPTAWILFYSAEQKHESELFNAGKALRHRLAIKRPERLESLLLCTVDVSLKHENTKMEGLVVLENEGLLRIFSLWTAITWSIFHIWVLQNKVVKNWGWECVP